MTKIKEITPEYFIIDIEEAPVDMWHQVPQDYCSGDDSLDVKIGINEDGDVSGAWIGKIELKISHKDSIELTGIFYEYQHDINKEIAEGKG